MQILTLTEEINDTDPFIRTCHFINSECPACQLDLKCLINNFAKSSEKVPMMYAERINYLTNNYSSLHTCVLCFYLCTDMKHFANVNGASHLSKSFFMCGFVRCH